MPKAETCNGLFIEEGPPSFKGHTEHCPGCTSASERIVELERALAGAKLAFELMVEKHTAMRTLAGELAARMQHVIDTRDLVKKSIISDQGARQAAAQDGAKLIMEAITSMEAALVKAKKLGVGNGG